MQASSQALVPTTTNSHWLRSELVSTGWPSRLRRVRLAGMVREGCTRVP